MKSGIFIILLLVALSVSANGPSVKHAILQSHFRQYLSQHIQYPQQARLRGLEGSVELSMTVPAGGKPVINILSKPLGGGLEEAVVKALMNYSYQKHWKQQHFNTAYRFTIHFELCENQNQQRYFTKTFPRNNLLVLITAVKTHATTT